MTEPGPSLRQPSEKVVQLNVRVTPEHKEMLIRLVTESGHRRATARDVVETLIETEYRRRFGTD